ncbi:MAG: crossover junction endodeoxyribonuclease RuvC [Spirochaetaceae bacterium]|nr:MAG: crossover junction endodeoxyribonuclease RuvC [Spirochaetaceae bacterium]
MRIILGIDPGLAQTGYGVIGIEANRFRHLDHGVITTEAGDSVGRRLHQLYRRLDDLLERYRPSDAGVESLYFARNVTSAIPVAQARGVVLLLLHARGIVTTEYPPQAIKQAIVGQGRAEKHQVQDLVRVLLGLSEAPRPDHAADALAAAICHYHSVEVGARIQAARES